MSANTDDTSDTDDASGDSGPGTREVAYRLFATEFDDATLSYSESDEERAPNYVVTPTGLRVNRLFTVGVLTEVERLNTDTLRGRIVDPTGAFVTYAGQYQPESQAFLDGADAPSFVSITGKARTFEPDDSDQIFTSVRPESLSEVTADTRDRWTVSAAEATLERVAVFAAALDTGHTGDTLEATLVDAGVDASLAAGIPRAIDHYGTTTAYLEAIRQCAVDALEVVADERDEVRSVDVAPGGGGDVTLGSLPAVDIDLADVTSESAPTPKEANTPTAEASAAATDSASESADSSAHTTSATTEPSDPTASATSESAEQTTSATTESPDTTATADVESDSADADTPASAPSSTTTETSDDSNTTTASDGSSPATSDDSPTPDATAESAAVEPSTTATTDTATESDTTRSATVDTATEPPASSESDQPDDTADAGDDPEMYELDAERAEELESEFGADFSSGNEVDPAGEADIDVPDADELAAEAEAADEPTADTEPTTASTDDTDTLGSFEDTVGRDDSDDEGDDDSDNATTDAAVSTDEPPESDASAANNKTAVDIEDAAVELMSDLDDGNGADREAVVAAVVDEHGVDVGAVEDAIDDALMGGRCYEPDDGTLKPI